MLGQQASLAEPASFTSFAWQLDHYTSSYPDAIGVVTHPILHLVGLILGLSPLPRHPPPLLAVMLLEFTTQEQNFEGL